MCGNETLTIEVSSTSSVVPSITASATSHLCEGVAGSEWAAAIDAAASIRRRYSACAVMIPV